jgi:hypothetical protein
LRGNRPASCDRRSNSALHHPGISSGGNPRCASCCCLSYRPEVVGSGLYIRCFPSMRASIELATFAIFTAMLYRSNAYLHHTGIFCAGNRWPRLCCLSAALSLSYSDFRRRQESNLRPSDPDVTQAFATPQTFSSFSLPPYFLTSLLHLPRTPISSRHQPRVDSPAEAPKNSGRNPRSRSLGLEPGALRPLTIEVPVNCTIPGEHPATDFFGSKRFRRIYCSRANQQLARPVCLGIVPTWLLSSCLIRCSFTLSEGPQNGLLQLRYPKSKRSAISCQALFSKFSVFGRFFA